MIFYEVDDEYLVGTQAEAKDSKRPWKQVDIPVDKAGLMAHLNTLMAQNDILDNSDPIVVDQPPPPPSYTETALKIEDLFDELPLALQLHYACLALENARSRIK